MKSKLPKLVLQTLRTLEEAGFEAYIVGGSVRDLILGKSVNDWDFTTNANPEQIQKLFPESFYTNKFGTVGITAEELSEQFTMKVDDDLDKDEVFEITTFRTESEYSDGRRPDVVNWGNSIEEDLQRRDFTINAIAVRVDLDDNLIIIDPYKGQKDIQNKIIKTVGEAKLRFAEDGLRILRAIRLAAQLSFTISSETLSAITHNVALLKNISWERKRDELLKIVVGKSSAESLKLMLSTGVLAYVLPEMLTTVGVEQSGHHTKDVWHHSIDAMQACPSLDPIVNLATLLHDVGKPVAYRNTNGKITFYGHEVVGGRIVKKIAQRLHLSNRDQQRLWILVRYHMFHYDPKMTDSAIRRMIRNIGLDNIEDMMMLRVGDRVGGGAKETSWRLEELQRRFKEVMITPMQIKDLKINGFDVMKVLNVKGGPIIGKVLQTLFEEVLEDSSKNEREYLLSKIKLIANNLQHA